MPVGEEIGSYAGGALGASTAGFFGQPELIPLATSVGSQIGKFVGRKVEKAVVKGTQKYFGDD